MARRSLASQLFRLGRSVEGVEPFASGNPRRIARRARNKLVGRALGRAGVWGWLWR